MVLKPEEKQECKVVFRIVEPNLQPTDIIEKTGNIGRNE